MPSVQGHSQINCVTLRIIIMLSLSEKQGNDFMAHISSSNSTVSFEAWRITVLLEIINAMQGYDYILP